MSNSALALIQKEKQTREAKNAAFQRTGKIAQGKHRYRILPTWREGSEDNQFFHSFAQHWVPRAGEKKVVSVCPEKTFGEPCSVCAALDAAISTCVDDKLLGELKEAKSKQRFVVNLLWLSNPDKAQAMTPVMTEVPFTIIEQIGDIMEEYDDITDLGKDGKELIINRTGSGFDTEYAVIQAKNNQAKVDESIMSQVSDIDAYVKQDNKLAAQNALIAVGVMNGLTAGDAAGNAARLVGGSIAGSLEDMSEDDELDDELLETLEAEDAEVVDADEDELIVGDEDEAEAAEAPDAEVADDDLDSLIADLDDAA